MTETGQMALPVQQMLAQAYALHNAGQLDKAQALYEAVLKTQPGNHDVLHLLGVVALQTNHHHKALELIDKAIAIAPGNGNFYSNRGAALQELAQFDAAVASYDRALELLGDNAEIWFNRGVALQALGRFEAAVASFDKTIKLRADDAQAYCKRGAALAALGQFDAAVASCDKAIALAENYAEAYFTRGVALRELKQFEAAVASYDKAIALRPGYVEAHFYRGIALHDLRQFAAAVTSYDKAIALKADLAEAYCNRGASLQDLGQVEAAIASYDRAIALKPDYAKAYFNRGFAMQLLNRLDDAIASCDKAIEIKPDFADAHWSKSLSLLAAGDFSNGWKLFEWRWQTGSQKGTQSNFSKPLWLGSADIAGKTIFVNSEQGLGDFIQFCRYVPMIEAVGAKVILEVPDPLISVISSLHGKFDVVRKNQPLPPFDLHCPLMSLPLAFNTTLSTIPNAVPYLHADPQKVQIWKELLGQKSRTRVGLVWSGGFRPNQPELWGVNERRNVKLAMLSGLGKLDMDFYSLQKGQPGESELAELKAASWNGPELMDFTSRLHDFSDTAALIENLDLVISVDTSTAHLAGALGKEVWLLNRFDSCWRWLLDRSDSPWYPTATVFRQRAFGDWTGVVAEVIENLEKFQ